MIKPRLGRSGLFIGLFLFLGLIPGSTWAGAQSGQKALVAITAFDLESNTQLLRLGGDYYANLTGPRGDTTLIAGLDENQRTQLAMRGITFKVLSEHSTGLRFGLIYFPGTDLLKKLEASDLLLWFDGWHALILFDENLLASLNASGETLRELPARIWPRRISGDLLRIPGIGTPDPAIQAMIEMVDPQAIFDQLEALTGEKEVTVNGNPYLFTTRYSRSEIPIQKATKYVWDLLGAFGLIMDFEYYTLPGSGQRRSVIAEQTGSSQPDRIVLLVAHLDDTSQNPYYDAPGADDNASGSVGVLTAASILSQYQFGCTIRYALFTGEEQGYYGSAEYAENAVYRGDDIEAVINLDMIGFDSAGQPVIELHTRNGNAADLSLAGLFTDVIGTYDLDLTVETVEDGLSWSDHSSFWDYGIPAILAMEDFQDFTPYYHTSNDELATLNLDYLTEYTRAAVGAIAHLGCGLSGPTPTSTPTPTQTATQTQTMTPTSTQTRMPLDGAQRLPLILMWETSLTPTP